MIVWQNSLLVHLKTDDFGRLDPGPENEEVWKLVNNTSRRERENGGFREEGAAEIRN